MYFAARKECKIMFSNIKKFEYTQLLEVLLRLRPIEKYYNSKELKDALDSQKDLQKLCEDFSKALKNDLSLEEIASLYSTAIMLLLLADPEKQHERLELLNDCFNYSDMLKPTMIDYSTRELLINFKYAATLVDDNEDYDYMLHLLWAIPHIVIASETGKMISLGLLRAFIAELTKSSPIVMHIYRNISEIWQMIKTVSSETILDEWPLLRIYTLAKSFGLVLSTAALNTSNTALKQAGYRGFEMPHPEVEGEIYEWFKTLRSKLDEKHKTDKSKSGLMLVRFIDFNILGFITEAGNEIASEAGNEVAA